MKRLSLLTLLSVAILLSCKNKDYKDYEGTWKGTYMGEDQGSWSMEVDEEGNVDGQARSNDFPDFPISIEGSVSKSGDVDLIDDSGFFDLSFEGKLDDRNADGTWVSKSDSAGTTVAISGSWSGSKD